MLSEGAENTQKVVTQLSKKSIKCIEPAWATLKNTLKIALSNHIILEQTPAKPRPCSNSPQHPKVTSKRNNNLLSGH